MDDERHTENGRMESVRSGPFLHDDLSDRNAASFGGTNSLYTGDGALSYLLLPIIPE
ncbi:MAG: hypothetical protein AVDCRST_MAG26-1991 [uncultured Chloroflexia bacterium]|uniref:Uncharacterized protein n=1 Tax=uncultured Chloroflexia bacterium TaxID=1672391 RepID=A0A6J4ILC3_9CHLR|nr:MAG: hypothetical protein AVDCRST_MAG26-1991 [uncultured Chloroflexia bacterium]